VKVRSKTSGADNSPVAPAAGPSGMLATGLLILPLI